MSKSLICAHAGAENSRDNSLESIAMLLDCGADLVEVDLWGPRGGDLVLCHDRPGPGEEHPLFFEALGLLAKVQGPRLNVDVKEPGAIFPAWNMACEEGLGGRIIFTGDVSWQEAQEALKQVYRIVYRSDLTIARALERIAAEAPPLPEVEAFADFIRSSERGIAR